MSSLRAVKFCHIGSVKPIDSQPEPIAHDSARVLFETNGHQRHSEALDVSPRRHRSLRGLEEPRTRGRSAARRASHGRASTASNAAVPAIEEYSVDVPSEKRFAHETAEFMPGAVIMLRLVDFQVTSDSTYQFGPLLNLVLGSNGTGKSTVINALFLLFRGLPSSLERRNYSECIQHGRSIAYVSAQIQGKDPDEVNPVLTMRLDRDQPKHADYFVNCRPISAQNYDMLLARYHIQVNNLCQFLSQFRVAAFSGETADQRLKSTEAAIGYDGIVQDHERLASAGLESSAITEMVEQRAALIEKLSENRADLQAKLAQAEETLTLKQRVLLLENVISIKKYRELEEELKTRKAAVKAAKLELKKFDIEMQPYLELLEQARESAEEAHAQIGVDRQSAQLGHEFTRSHQNLVSNQQLLNSLISQLGRAQKIVTKLNDETDLLDNKFTDAKLETSQMRHAVQEKALDSQAYNDLLMSSRQRQDEYAREAQKVQRLKEEEHDKKRELAFKQNDLHNQETRLTTLQKNSESQNGDSANGLSSDDPNLNYPYRKPEGVRRFWYSDQGLLKNVKVVQQLQSNSTFQKPVVLPAILSLRVTDRRVLPALSFAIRSENLHKFVCLTDRDQQLLAKLGARENLTLRTTIINDKNNTSHQPLRAAIDHLKKTAFDGVLTDYLEGPPAMIKFMKALGLDQILISFKPINQKMTALIRNVVKDPSNSGGLRVADNSFLYSFNRSKYGQHQVTEENRKFPSKLIAWAEFVYQGPTTEDLRYQQQETRVEVDQLQASIASLRTRISALQDELNDKRSRINIAQERTDDVRRVAHELAVQYQKEKTLRDRLSNAISKEEAFKEALEVKRNELQRESSSLQTLLAQVNEAVLRMVKEGEKPGSFLSATVTASHTNSRLQSVYRDHKNKYEYLKAALAKKRQVPEQELQNRETELEEAKESQREARLQSKNASQWIRDNDKGDEAFQIDSEMSISQMRDEMNRARATVTLHDQRSDSPASIRAKLASTEERLAYEEQQQSDNQNKLHELSELNENIRTQWETEVRSIVERISQKFSELFKEVGCRGYVALDTPDPLAVGAWGIDIFVSFRPDEEPSKLSKMRQSGGERAVTTAIYLLSLQTLASAPFRVLDEINQGMDETNERTTMKFFVNLSCELEDRSPMRQQYFLVTPKLISNMPWHKNMNIVFIFGGETIKGVDKLLKPTQVNQRNVALRNTNAF